VDFVLVHSSSLLRVERKDCFGATPKPARETRALPFAIRSEFKYLSVMPTEISIPDAEDLKSRVRELRRFL
jgi:hypothetical protein